RPLPASATASSPAVRAHTDAGLRVSMPDLQPIADGERFEAGGIAFVGVHTPGHRREMLSLYAPDRRLLIASDSVQGQGNRSGRFPLIGFSGRAYRQSLERMRALDVDALVVGHPYLWSGEASIVHRGPEVRRYVEESLAVSEEIAAAVEAAAPEPSGAAPDALVRPPAGRPGPRVRLALRCPRA